MNTFNLIKDWLTHCVNMNRFCPDNNGNSFNQTTNISPYITSDGDVMNGMPIGDVLLRVKKANIKSIQDDVFQLVAQRIQTVYGQQLFTAAHMGEEVCIYRNALIDLTNQWQPDFRQLISKNMFNTRKIFTKVDILNSVPGLMDWGLDQAPPSAKSFSFMQGGESNSFAIGIHWSTLLSCVSMMDGAMIHPKISSNMAKSILREILKRSPQAATPGNDIPLRAFNVHNTVTERILIPQKITRPAHFIRPIDDGRFINRGVLTYARGISNLLPEDALHCGGLFQFMELFACSITDLPHVDAEYELMVNTHYTLWKSEKNEVGTIFLDQKLAKAVVTMGDRQINLQQHEWCRWLAVNGFIIFPMIWRQGACVALKDDDDAVDIGCLIPFEHGNNFDPDSMSYKAIFQEGDVRSVHPAKVMQNIIPVGTEVYIKLYIERIKGLVQDKLIRANDNRQYLYARINIPSVDEPEPGLVYVSCVIKPIKVHDGTKEQATFTIPVYPWEFILDLPDEEAAVKFLILRPVRPVRH